MDESIDSNAGTFSTPEVGSWGAKEFQAVSGSDLFDSSERIDFDWPAPAVVSLNSQPDRPKVQSYCFSLWEQKPFEAGAGTSAKRPSQARPRGITNRPARKSTSRMKPPTDMVRLQDRLFYLLQPPMETLVSNSCVEFPFEPFPYQYEGVAFLFPRQAAILADEMGLGKTMQAITTLRLLIRSGQVKSALLICPKPLVPNWKREFQLWAPEIGISVIEGNQTRREFQWGQRSVPVTIANYELVTRDQETVHDPEFQTDLVILDEAQRIKNKNSNTSKVVRGIARSRSWALTGTPIENSQEDLVGIFEFLSQGYLSAEMPAHRLASEVKDFIIRRTKDQVLTDMPPRLTRDAELELTTEQWESYSQAEEAGVIRLNDLGKEMTIQHVFELVLRLKQICNFDPRTGASSKLERLSADIEEIAQSGQKAIVFSQWVNTLEQIQTRLSQYQPLAYHGRIPSSRREAVLDEFKNNPDRSVLLMSYGAGSVGLNLQFCRYVFLFDRWWNPAVEDQAINRAHRIGAAGSVTVTRMLTLATIEERINQVLEEKRELFHSILSDASQPASAGLTRKEIFGLFQIKTPRSDAA